jgi:pilus assembly protein CpaE
VNRAVIAVADQVIVQELRSRLDQSEPKVDVVFVAESTSEMVSAVLRYRPALVFVHDQLGPGSVNQTVRDLTLRNPGLAVLLVSASEAAETYIGALDAGARGVLSYPFGLEDVDHRLASVLEWSQMMRAAISNSPDSADLTTARGGRLIAVAGAKGGVGATIIASHLAWDALRSEPNLKVCLVDLDIEKGDVPSYLDVSHRVSVADLAKISEDLAARAVSDTVVVHSSGLHLLLAPIEIRDTEFVTPEAVRRILAELRSLYHLVIVDSGSAVTTTQAAAVESADVTLQIVTADVPALRAARRQVVAWESLGVTSADSVRVVVNRFVRRSEIQQDTIDMLTLGERSEVLIPDLDQGLERAGNSRTPAEVRNGTWWKSLRAISQELDADRAYRDAVTAARRSWADGEVRPGGDQPATNGHRQPAEGRKTRRLSRDAGQVTLETVALVPVALIVLVICLQVVLIGVSFVWSGVAAAAAARAASLGEDPAGAARAAVPAGLQSDLSVSAAGARVSVTVRAPLLMTDGVTRDVLIDTDHRVVEEPR